MRSTRPRRRLVLATLAVAAASGLAVGVAGLFGERAVAAEKLVAGSVCQAHELKARKALDPALEIEIPAQFDLPWPTRAACLSHEAALDPNTPGPVQPIPFSHKHHAGLYQVDCQYCHTGTNRSAVAGVPSDEVCMGCHSLF